MMKVGDKLTCKKTYRTNIKEYWVEGQEYEITDITNDVYYSIFTSETKDGGRWSYGFNIEGLGCEPGETLFDIFYSPKELRIKKLDSL